MDLPWWCLNQLSVAAFNTAYYHMQRGRPSTRLMHYDPFFYPLDGVYAWNRIYGRRGFMQFQCVVPMEGNRTEVLRELLDRSARSGLPSFLTVAKTFGDKPSPGWMSFPRPGVTLTLDFANRGEKTWRLLAEMERVVLEAKGRLYPAKDARMRAESFAASYPERERFVRYVDPAFSSSFWRRVKGGEGLAGRGD
jgi:FAD/FMN-containing dehydrogenase